MSSSVRERVYKVVSDVMNLALEHVDGNTSPDNAAEWDSVKHINLVLALEEEFSITIGEEHIVDMLNVDLVHEIVKENL